MIGAILHIASRYWPALVFGVVALAIIGGAYMKGRADCGVAQLRAEISELKADIAKRQEIARNDAERARQARLTLTEQDRRIKELLNDLEDGDSVCLSGDDTDGLRSLWREQAGQ